MYTHSRQSRRQVSLPETEVCPAGQPPGTLSGVVSRVELDGGAEDEAAGCFNNLKYSEPRERAKCSSTTCVELDSVQTTFTHVTPAKASDYQHAISHTRPLYRLPHCKPHSYFCICCWHALLIGHHKAVFISAHISSPSVGNCLGCCRTRA